MFKFTPFLLALAIIQAGARKLSEELIHTYEPRTSVTDHAAIDLDQQAIEEQLAAGTDEGFTNARKIYQMGAFSKSYAVLNLTTPLTSQLQMEVPVTGKSTAGDEIRGTVLEDADAGDSVLNVQYATSNVQASYVGCQVGANPTPVTTGCFVAAGEIVAGAMDPLSYSYSVATGNLNARTLQYFSTTAKAKMYDCEKCPYDTYKKFYDYYGAFDYADQWVMAAFNKAKTAFTNGNADFSAYGTDGLTEAIKKGTAYMNVFMYVIREMKDAVDDCENGCATTECNSDPVNALDEAVAFYTGSLVKSDPKGGVLLYTLAQKRCENFKTCGDDGVAAINTEIFTQFQAAQQNFQLGKCADAAKNIDKVIAMMAVPLVQGTLRYAHIIGEENGMTEKAEAEGATFAATVLPLLHACNAADASTVYNNMKTGSGATKDFAAVKKAFEDNYDCMGITCAQVGGLVQADLETYFPGAEPCGNAGSSASGSSISAFQGHVGFAVAAYAGAIAALIA